MQKALRVLLVVVVDSAVEVLEPLGEHLLAAFVCVADVTVALFGVGTDKMPQTNCSIPILVLVIAVVI